MFEFYMFCELFFVRMVSKVCIPKGFDIFQDPEYRIVCGWAKIFHETTLNSTKQDKLVCFMLFSKYVRWDWEKVAVAKKYIFLYNIHHMPSSDENMELSYQALNEGMCLLHYNAMKRFVGAMAVALLAVVAYLHIWVQRMVCSGLCHASFELMLVDLRLFERWARAIFGNFMIID